MKRTTVQGRTYQTYAVVQREANKMPAFYVMMQKKKSMV
jgi:hypothetical protein